MAAALTSRKNELTILVVNESYRAIDVKIELEGLPAPVRLLRYSLTKEMEDKCR